MNPFDLLLADLQSNQLVTILAPSRRSDRREWDQIRVNLSVSPRWYSAFCGRHLSSRGVRRGKPDTKIKRRNVTRLLARMAAGIEVRSKYADELRRIAEKNLGNFKVGA